MERLLILTILLGSSAFSAQKSVDKQIAFINSKINTKEILLHISNQENIPLKYLRIPKIGAQEWESSTNKGFIIPIKNIKDGSCSLNWFSNGISGIYTGWPYCEFSKSPVFIDIDGDGYTDIIYTINLKTSADSPIYTHEISLIYRSDIQGFCLSNTVVPWYVFKGVDHFTPKTLQCP